MTVSLTRVAALSALCAGSLLAQPPRDVDRPAALPVLQTIALDLSAALQERWLFSAEPVVFGRFTIGLLAGYTTVPDRESQPFGPMVGGVVGGFIVPCPLARPIGFPPGCPDFRPARQRYRASQLSLHTRWYPDGLSRDRERQRVGIYVGEFLGYHERRVEWPQTIAYYGPADTLAYADSALPYPGPVPVFGPGWVQRIHGWEPGAELGARLMMGRRVIFDFGGSVRIVTLDDPLSRRRPGETDARFVLLVGVGW